MARAFLISDRYPSPAPGRCADTRSDGTAFHGDTSLRSADRPSPLNPMGARAPGYCADPAQNPGDCPTENCDYAPLSHDIKLVKMTGRDNDPIVKAPKKPAK